jgi:hypothetical protein
MVEMHVRPEWGSGRSGCAQETCIFFIGDLGCGKEKGINPDAVHGTLVGLAGFGAHGEPAFGDANECGFEGRGWMSQWLRGHAGFSRAEMLSLILIVYDWCVPERIHILVTLL